MMSNICHNKMPAIAGFLWLVIGLSTTAVAQRPEKSEGTRLRLDAKTTLELFSVNSKSFVVANVELPPVEPQKKYLLRLEVSNPLTREIVFDRVQSSCSCGRLQTKSATFPPGKSVVVDVSFETPKSIESGQFVFDARCYDVDTEVVNFRVGGELHKNLYIERQSHFSIAGSLSAFRIPIVFSKPIAAKTMSVTKSESLGDIQAEIIEDHGRHFVELLVEANAISGSYITGRIKVSSKEHGVEAASEVIIAKKSPITVSPSALRFSEAGSEARSDEPTRVARAMVQVDLAESVKLAEKQRNVLEVQKIWFRLKDVPLAIETKKLAKSIFRVKLTAPADKLAEHHNKKIRCVVVFTDGTMRSQDIRFLVLAE